MNKGYQIVLPVAANNVTMLKERIVRGDSDTHIFNLHLMDGGKPFNLKDITAIKINVKKEDDTLTMITSGNKNLLIKDVAAGEINLTLPDHMTNVPGLCRLSVELYEQERRLTTTTLIYQVIESLADSDRSIADNVDAFAALQEYIRKESGTITINSVTTGAPSSVTNIGTPQAAVLNFTLEKGEKGDKGDQGIQGIQGIQGPKGDKGDKGEKGDQGIQGIQGIQGEQGVKGEKGDQGYQGIQGVQGIKGDKGDQGIPGPQGPQGEKGEQGFRGVQGLQGPQGEQGIQGPIGLTGATGPQGPIGLTGEKGDKGEQGIQGIQGEPGTDGTLVNLNGEVQTNVNFIANGVVQDGLIGSVINWDKKNFNNTGVKAIYLHMNIISENIYMLYLGDLKAFGLTSVYTGISRTNNASGYCMITNKSITRGYCDYVLTLDAGYLILNDLKNMTYKKIENTENLTLDTINTKVGGGNVFDNCSMFAYNRQLTSQEIQHNFSILNNSPSINKINDYTLSTDTDHVQDRTGRVQEDINRVFYKQNCKEFTSNGEAITVNNGLDGYLLQTKIEGQTVKKYIEFDMTNNIISNSNKRRLVSKEAQIPIGEYVIKFSVSNIIGTSFPLKMRVSNKDASYAYITLATVNKNGVYEYKLSWSETYSKIDYIYCDDTIFNDNNISFQIDYICVVSLVDKDKINSYIPFGLNSTQATISNLGIKYSFYSLLDDKLNNRVITLGSTATKRDTLEIKEDGSAIYTQNTQNNTDGSARVDLATPVVVSIDKSLVPTILTQATNTFTFGEEVSPYSAIIQVPCTDDIKKSYALTLLNGYIQTANTATPVINLLNTGIVRLQMDLTAPSTGMNATLFSLPLELRPVTTQRIPVFVNGVCQLATIDKTTGNVNLASVPSASANVYIKSDYRRDI